MTCIIYDINKIIENYSKIPSYEYPSVWLNYYQHHKIVFNELFRNLYRMNQHEINELISQTDFNNIFSNAIENYQNLDFDLITRTIHQCRTFYQFNIEFKVYFLAGLGHIDGTAQRGKPPFLFSGLERMRHLDIPSLIKHEFNHLVRFNVTKEFDSFDAITVGQLAIAEGLATLSPLIMDNKKLTHKNLTAALFTDTASYDIFLKNEETLMEQFHQDKHKILTPALHSDYFTQNEISDMSRKGYFIGMTLITKLINNCTDLKKLTETPTVEILRKINNVNRKI